MKKKKTVRAVAFVLATKGINFEIVNTMPGAKKKGGSRSPEYLAMVPSGTVPALVDVDNQVTIWESNAILQYVAEKFKMQDLWPSDDPVKRAQITQWMNWHHHNSRNFTMALFAPLMRPDLKFSTQEIQARTKQLNQIAKLMDKHLQKTGFLVGDRVTLADICCYEDMGQCRSEHLGLFDFAPYPYINKWMDKIETLPKFKETHKVLSKLKPLIDSVRAKQSKNAAKL